MIDRQESEARLKKMAQAIKESEKVEYTDLSELLKRKTVTIDSALTEVNDE